MPTRRSYDTALARELEKYFRRHVASKVGNSAARTYLLLSYVEQDQGGCCAPITLDERSLARSVFVARNTIVKDLRALAAVGVIEYKPGQAVLVDGKATQLRRFTPGEIKGTKGSTALDDHTPGDAAAVCDVLNARTFVYDGQPVRPRFAACSTGRIYTSQPNPQQDDEDTRFRKALTGTERGEFVIEVDYRQADATVVCVLLDEAELYRASDWPTDIYQELATLMGTNREEAKKHGNRLFYCTNSRAYVNSLCVNAPRGTFVRDIAIALDKYKARLWEESRPRGKRPASVTTLGGTVIKGTNGQRRKSIHRGTLLNWKCQGTVADAMNSAVRKLIDMEAVSNWRVLFPIHDSVIMTTTTNCSREVQDVMEDAARVRGLPINTKSRVEANGSEMSRRKTTKNEPQSLAQK